MGRFFCFICSDVFTFSLNYCVCVLYRLVISQMRAAGELHRRGKEGKAKQNTV